ncbi:MAG: peptide-methionine (S)-S-oxide reductase MsrA [Methylovirgula sp.]|jgi:peptide-methionine (S)-S-oxide reductase
MRNYLSPLRRGTWSPLWIGGAVVLAGLLWSLHSSAEPAVAIPPPAMDETAPGPSETVVLSGGCFWGVQDVFQHVKGVNKAVSGYAGGTAADASYPIVSSGTTGHAESVEVSFDPRIVSYGKILQIYFSVAHNPTELNFQGPDEGTQYRSNIFATSDAQKKIAEAYIAQLDKTRVFPDKIVTRVDSFQEFYPAEGYHQDYATLHPDNFYIATNDLPKVDHLRQLFPDVYREKPVLVGANAND